MRMIKEKVGFESEWKGERTVNDKTGDDEKDELVWVKRCEYEENWLVGFVAQLVERRSLTGELSLSCARPAADGWPLMWVNRRL